MNIYYATEWDLGKWRREIYHSKKKLIKTIVKYWSTKKIIDNDCVGNPIIKVLKGNNTIIIRSDNPKQVTWTTYYDIIKIKLL